MNTPTPKHQALAVTWAAPASDNNSAVTGYDVQYRAGSSGAWTSWPHTDTTRSATITGLTNNTEYQVQVRARNARGNSFWSASVKATPVPQKPDAPAAPTLTSSGTTLTVSWAAPLANGADITDYDVSYCSSTCTSESNWTEWNAGNTSTALSASITNLVNGTTYQVRVRAQNSVGESDWSTAATHAIGRPGAPAAPTLTSGNAQLTAKWSAPAGTVTITDYDVQYSSNGGATWTEWNAANTSTDLEATVAGLNNGTTYQVQVRAESSLGPGPWSPSASIKAGLPEGTSGIRVEPVSDGLYVYFTVPSGNGSAVIRLDLRYSSNGGTTWTERLIGLESGTPTGANFRYPVTGLTNGVAYQVQVRAKNQHGAGPWSDVYTATPGTPDAPSAPTLTAGDHKLLVNWSAPGDNGSAITDYDVRYSANGGSSWSEWQPNTDSAANSAVITGLTPDTTYQVQVRATNTHGDSAWSASSAHTLAVSPVPTLSFHYCNPSKLNQLWVDNACFIKAGQHGTKPFNSARVASGGDYVELTNYSGTVQALPYNPNGGLAIVETLDSNNVVQDTFQIDVIRFQIRDTEVTGTLKAMESSYLTVRLHSLSNGSPDKFLVNGSDFARSWVQLDLPNELIAQDHNDTWQDDPIQVVDHHGDSVTFRMIPTSAGAFSIGIAAYRPAPDAGCPTEGELRCFQPPVDRLTKEYVAAAQVSVQAAFAAPNPPAAPANLAASAGDGSVTLSWDDPQNPTISGYEYNVNHNDTNSGNLSGWSDWQSIAGSDADTTSHTFSGLDQRTRVPFPRAGGQRGRQRRRRAQRGPLVRLRHPRGAAVRSARRRLRRQRHPRRRLPDRLLGRPRRRNQIPRHLHRRRRQELARARGRPHEHPHQQPHLQRRQRQDLRHRRPRRQRRRLERLAQLPVRRAVHPAEHAHAHQSARPRRLGDGHPQRRLPHRHLGRPRRRDQIPRHLHRRRRQELARARGRPHEHPHQQPQLQHRQRQDLRHRSPRRQRHRLERLAQLAARRTVSAGAKGRPSVRCIHMGVLPPSDCLRRTPLTGIRQRLRA